MRREKEIGREELLKPLFVETHRAALALKRPVIILLKADSNRRRVME